MLICHASLALQFDRFRSEQVSSWAGQRSGTNTSLSRGARFPRQMEGSLRFRQPKAEYQSAEFRQILTEHFLCFIYQSGADILQLFQMCLEHGTPKGSPNPRQTLGHLTCVLHCSFFVTCRFRSVSGRRQFLGRRRAKWSDIWKPARRNMVSPDRSIQQ